ncbi:inositol 1,4,5-trisphosphate receptor-interacting protein-like 1 [Heliangelus exortis]|uniref:inositol 1,4,5-trisphosphate receptor-interacting protein-like 1 n=1 Tax=Heliangelus exortis TaxID=472823 RepID=UPI003A8CA431
MLLLAVFCWLARNKQFASRGSSSMMEKDNKQEQEDPRGKPSVGRALAVPTPSPVQDLPDICKVVKELVGDLLGVCQMLSKKTSMPQVHPVPGMDGTSGFWRVQENTITYTLPVFLQPPPGHSFRLQMDTTGQLPAGHRNVIHVGLECTCWRDQLLGNISCFLHHPTSKLPGDQSSDLLRTLCTRSCLDLKKIACWARLLVRSAWLLLPQSHHCQLTVLPSSHSCMFQLTGISEVNIFTEMIFGVQRGSSVTCLSQE